MDRLSALIVLSLLACDSKKEEQPLPGRADLGKSAKKTVDTKAFCDVQFEPGKGPKLTVPKLVGGRVFLQWAIQPEPG